MHREFINYLGDTDDEKLTFSVGELPIIIDFLDLMGIDSNRIRNLYYYYKFILKELDSHYLEFKYTRKYKNRQINKVDVINDVGDLPLFDSEDIF